MKFNFLNSKVLFTALVLCGAIGAPAIAQYTGGYYPPNPNTGGYYPPGPYPNPVYPVQPPVVYPSNNPPVYRPPAQRTTAFVCGRVGKYPATLVQVNGQTRPAPLIVFQTPSDNLSPEQRCNGVSQRLTAAVAQNGGKLSNLLLTTGKVNGQAVICVVNSAETCNPSNVLLTLIRRENAKNPGTVLARIARYARNGGGTGAIESGGSNDTEYVTEIEPVSFSLEEVVNEVGGATGSPESGGAVPSDNQAPSNVPDTGTGGGPI